MTPMTSLWLDTNPVTAPAAGQLTAGAGLTGLTNAVLLARSGQRLAVLEGRTVGAAATDNTTARVSLLQGTTLSQIRSHQTDRMLRAYVEGNREGQAWLLRNVD